MCWTGPLTGDVAACRAGAALLTPVSPDAGGVPVPTLVTALLTVLVTDPATGLTTVLLAGPVTALVTGPVTVLVTGLATVPVTDAATGLVTALGTLVVLPPAGEAADSFGLALDGVPGVVPALWPLPWPAMTS